MKILFYSCGILILLIFALIFTLDSDKSVELEQKTSTIKTEPLEDELSVKTSQVDQIIIPTKP